jgi:hypothetical protein
MVLKDWKKFATVKGINQKGKRINVGWIDYKTGNILSVTEFLIGSSFPDNRKFTGESEWVVMISGEIIYKSIKRDLAIKKAKNYMRSH